VPFVKTVKAARTRRPLPKCDLLQTIKSFKIAT
jgi:hypothetical protein